ncbi:MAG: hypothetical protein AB7K24_15515 [Gemmataceae bacterium]
MWYGFVAAALLTGAEPEAIKPELPVNQAALDRIKSLKANQAAVVGQAKVVGDFNDVARQYNLDKTGPRGRDFTIKMVWSPERKRVLFCGANHGVPHRLNDVWEFDLAALTWAMLYAPDNPRDYGGLGKDFSDVEFKDGILITQRGGPAVIAHTWWGLTYDPVQKQMLFMNTWVTNKKKAVEDLKGDPAQLYPGPPLWAFTPQTGKWQMLKTDAPYPRPIFGGLLEYCPDLKGSLWHANNWQMHGTWIYDAKTSKWTDLKANGKSTEFEQQSPAPEQVGYYDPQRKLIVVQRHNDTFHFHPKTNVWQKVKIDQAEVPYGHDARAPMYFDPVSGHGLLVDFKTNTLWAYDANKPAWVKLQPEGDPLPTGNKRLAYVDPAHNALVVIEGTKVWAYRYRTR